MHCVPGRQTCLMVATASRKSVRRKLNAIIPEFAGKDVLLVDDSIVRGTTSKEIVQMAREAGANKVYLASCAPPIRYHVPQAGRLRRASNLPEHAGIQTCTALTCRLWRN